MPRLGFRHYFISFLVSLAAAYLASWLEWPMIVDWVSNVAPTPAWGTILRYSLYAIAVVAVFFVGLVVTALIFGWDESENGGGNNKNVVHAKRDFTSLHPVIVDCIDALSSLPDTSNEYTRTDGRDAPALEVEAQVDALARDLDELSIPTIPVRVFPNERKIVLLNFLRGLEECARDNRLEAAVRFAEQYKADFEVRS